MACSKISRFLASVATLLRIGKEVLFRDSAVGNCIQLMSRLETLCQNQPAKRAIATEWVNGLPIILQLCEKLPGRTEMIRQYINALPLLMEISRNLPEAGSPFVQQFPELSRRSVIREQYLMDVCKGKNVLHFGFLDSPFSEERIHSGDLLHLKLRSVTNHLYGIDSDRLSLDRYRQLTGDNNNSVGDIQREWQDGIWTDSYDLVLLPEILEHLGNPAGALANLRRLCVTGGRAKLCVTVPNAYYTGSVLRAMDGDEIVHPEHYYYFSPATLRKLLQDTGFTVVELALYASRDSALLPGITKNGVIAMCEAV